MFKSTLPKYNLSLFAILYDFADRKGRQGLSWSNAKPDIEDYPLKKVKIEIGFTFNNVKEYKEK